MSEYFSNLPLLTYDLDRKKPSTQYLAIDIFRRNVIREKVLTNIITPSSFFASRTLLSASSL